MTRRCCSNCDYWFQTNPVQIGGQCRRYAPRYWDKDHSAIPQTVKDYWCGDFAEKQPREDDSPLEITVIPRISKSRRRASG